MKPSPREDELVVGADITSEVGEFGGVMSSAEEADEEVVC